MKHKNIEWYEYNWDDTAIVNGEEVSADNINQYVLAGAFEDGIVYWSRGKWKNISRDDAVDLGYRFLADCENWIWSVIDYLMNPYDPKNSEEMARTVLNLAFDYAEVKDADEENQAFYDWVFSDNADAFLEMVSRHGAEKFGTSIYAQKTTGEGAMSIWDIDRNQIKGSWSIYCGISDRIENVNADMLVEWMASALLEFDPYFDGTPDQTYALAASIFLEVGNGGIIASFINRPGAPDAVDGMKSAVWNVVRDLFAYDDAVNRCNQSLEDLYDDPERYLECLSRYAFERMGFGRRAYEAGTYDLEADYEELDEYF